MSSAPVTWSKIMRSVKHGDTLHAVRSNGPAHPRWDAEFRVNRVTTKGVYVQQEGGKRLYLPWPAARHVTVLDSRTWILVDSTGKTAWTIQP